MDHLRQATQQTFNNSQNNKKLFFGTNLSPHATLLKPLWILSFLNKFIIGLCYELCWLYCREQSRDNVDRTIWISYQYIICVAQGYAQLGPIPLLSVHCLVVILHYWLWQLVAKSVEFGLWFLFFTRGISSQSMQFEGVSSIQPWCWELLSSRHADNVSWCLTLSHTTRHVSAWNWGVLL